MLQLASWSSGQPYPQSDCLIVFIDENQQPQLSCYRDDQNLTESISNLAKTLHCANALGEKAGDSLLLPLISEADSSSFKAVYFIRTEPKLDSSDKVRKFANQFAAKLAALPYENLMLTLDSGAASAELEAELGREISLGCAHKLYQFNRFKSNQTASNRVAGLTWAHEGIEDSDSALNEAEALISGIELCRDLGNLPGNHCTPTVLADKAAELGSEYNLDIEVLDEAQMQELGMGSLLSVSAGSEQPAKLIVAQYQGADDSVAPQVLVGKGITFDSGGISLKPGAGMDEMKYDMCGAASVFGTLLAVCKMKLPINLVAIVAAAENMPSGRATKPGDIVTSMSGQTIEVLNTDAEGRLVLCDALTYAERFNPESVVDIATLTGACVIALGSHATGLYANDDNLADALLSAGQATGDRAWRMPLWDDYTKQLKSNFADLANIGGREAGSVTAACFLSKFAEKMSWAHLDIAGTAWRSGANKNATGRPVRLLVEFLKDKAG